MKKKVEMEVEKLMKVEVKMVTLEVVKEKGE